MCFWLNRFYDDVIDVDLYQLPDEIMEDVIHRPLVGCSGVLEAEGHDNPFKQANVTRISESSFEYILF